MYFRFAFLFGAFAAHTTAQDLTQEQLDFIRANAAAVEAALQSGRTRRENEGPTLKTNDGNIGVFVDAGKSFSINCPATSGPVPCVGKGVEVVDGRCVAKESNFVTKVEQLQTMIDVNSKLGAIETSQDDLKDAQAEAIQEIKDEATEQAAASAEAAAATKKDLLASVKHLEALDEAAVVRLTCIGKKRVSDDGTKCIDCGGAYIFNEFLSECIGCGRDPDYFNHKDDGCTKVSGACDKGTFQVAKATTTTDRKCKDYTVCTKTQYAATAGTPDKDVTCEDTSDRLCIKAAASCLGYYELDNDAKDGYYIIETKDGASAKAYCDMTNGGWTI
eukprot:gene21523-32720_t